MKITAGNRLQAKGIGLIHLSCLCLGLLGCQAGWQEARSSYLAGQYPEALDSFAEAAAELPHLSAEEQAGFILYRGLSYFSTGHLEQATAWLGLAKHRFDEDPSLFSAQERAALFSAWNSLGKAAGESAFKPAWLVQSPR